MIKFTYLSTVYIYERGYIYKESRVSSYNDLVCRVHDDLVEILKSFSEEQSEVILKSTLHSYLLGCNDGRVELVKEFKKLFSIKDAHVDW